MEYQEYIKRTQQVNTLMLSGRLKEAVVALYKLFLSDISDIDKLSLCTTLAFVYDQMAETDEAISWYDKGIDLEKTYCRFEVSELKAKYLAQNGRSKEAITIYESLVKQQFLSEADKERMRIAIQTLLGKALG